MATNISVQPRKLLLFDIDGTLLASGGAGERALRQAVLERFGVDDDLKTIEIAGRTDSGIARQVLKKYGKPETPEEIAAFLDTYLHHLALYLPQIQGRLLPGIIPLLDALKNRTDVVLALLTGNVERGAKLKLSHYGVWHYFEFGAYADDHYDRNELGHFARQRAKAKHGLEFPSEQIYVLGDTPHDIACARAIGAKAIAIATGGSSRERLAEHSPDFLFDDLSDLPSVFAAIGLE
jgi:phosphoglycolate phosphatase-like HAD superfamily hydrolase